MADATVVARNLTRRYGDLTAVAGVDLTLHAGEIFGLLGPNGAGKTTTMEMMEGLRRPDSGTCSICGFDNMTQAAAVRERIGLTLQADNLPGTAKVGELVELYASFYRNPTPPGALLRQLGLTEKAASHVKSLSGGQRKRLSLALALVGRPEVLFLDEPTTALDPQARQSLWEVIEGLRAQGRTILMSTHYMEEAERLCDRVAIMDHGQILAEGTPRDLIREYGPKTDDLMALARERGLAEGDLRIRSATLEDVFLTLTGRRLRD